MEEKNYEYRAQIMDLDNDQIIANISALTEESFNEELSKGKWLNAVSVYEINEELEKDIDNEHAEDLKDDVLSAIKDNVETDDESCDDEDHDCHLSPDDGCSVCDNKLEKKL
jgi:hypothetical protein